MNKKIDTAITKEQLQHDLETLNKIQNVPNLHLAHFFIDLRNQVEKEIASSQSIEQDTVKKNEFEKMRKEIMAKIDSFEKNCLKTQFLKFSSFKLRTKDNLNLIETQLKISTGSDLNEIRQSIYNEEISIFKKLFQNKTIAFLKPKQWIEIFRMALDHGSIGKLIIVNDAFIPNIVLNHW
jgi:hypothetical protein